MSRIGGAAAAAIALAVALLVAPAGPAQADVGETEPNNTIATADAVPLGQTVTAVGYGGSPRVKSSDEDYFAYDVPAAGRGTIDLRFPTDVGTGSAYAVRVYDGQGNRLYMFRVRGGDADGARLAAQGTFVPAGRVYVQISSDDGYATWNRQYSLKFSVTAGTVETEPNATTATADPLSLGTTVSGSALAGSPDLNSSDTDFFVFEVPKSGRASFSLRFPSGLGTGYGYVVRVFDASGQRLYFEQVSADQHDGTRLASLGTYLPAGRTYIQIDGEDDSATWGQTYRLRVDVTPAAGETEPNESTATADRLPLGTKLGGSSLGGSPYLNSDDHDYYSVDLPQAGRVAVLLTFPGDRGTGRAYTVRVYDQGGRRTHSFDVAAADWGGERLASQRVDLPAGRSYVEVVGDDDHATWGAPYSLLVGPVAFIDVPAWHPFFSEIGWMSTAGISTGYDAGAGARAYRPEASVTRDAMAAFLYRASGSPAFTAPRVSPFLDVPTDHPFYREITWLAARGVSTGWPVAGGVEFRPGADITRDAMAAFLYRNAKSPAYTPPRASAFVDVEVTSPFYKEISWMASKGISTGYDVGGAKEYRPFNPVARDAMAAFLSRATR